jgi:hypothetical protein
MYVNERTLDYGEDGREAIRKLLDLGFERGIIPIASLRWTSSTLANTPPTSCSLRPNLLFWPPSNRSCSHRRAR